MWYAKHSVHFLFHVILNRNWHFRICILKMFCLCPTWSAMVWMYSVSTSKQKLGEFASMPAFNLILFQKWFWLWRQHGTGPPSASSLNGAVCFFVFFKVGLWCQTPVIYFSLENTWPFVCVSQPYRCSLSCLTTHTRTALESARPATGIKGGESEVKQTFSDKDFPDWWYFEVKFDLFFFLVMPVESREIQSGIRIIESNRILQSEAASWRPSSALKVALPVAAGQNGEDTAVPFKNKT